MQAAISPSRTWFRALDRSPAGQGTRGVRSSPSIRTGNESKRRVARVQVFFPLHSIFFLLCLPDKKKATEHVSVNSCRRSLLGTDASSRASCVLSLRSPQGRVSRRVSYEGHSSAEETVDLCEWTEDCPLGPGQITFAGRRLKVPWYSPPGSYKYRYALHDRDGSLLLCAEIDLR